MRKKDSTFSIHGVDRPGRKKIYDDPVRHLQHWTYLRKKSQALYRNEEWDLSIQDWFRLWDESDQWDNRGRHKDSSAMFMIDPERGWSIDNVEIVNRSVRLKEMLTGREVLIHQRGGRPKRNG